DWSSDVCSSDLSKKDEKRVTRGYLQNRHMCSSGGMFRGKQNSNGILSRWVSAARVQSQSERPPRTSTNSASIPYKPFERAPQTLPSRSKVKSGSNPSPTANVIPLNRRRSTHGDTTWTS